MLVREASLNSNSSSRTFHDILAGRLQQVIPSDGIYRSIRQPIHLPQRLNMNLVKFQMRIGKGYSFYSTVVHRSKDHSKSGNSRRDDYQ